MRKKKEPKYKIAGVADLREILEKQNYRCALTGVKLEPDNTAFDHIVPLSKGGNSLKDNLQAVTKIANRMKHDLSNKEFLKVCTAVLSHLKG